MYELEMFERKVSYS